MALRGNIFQRKFFWAALVTGVLAFFLVFQPAFMNVPVRFLTSTLLWPLEAFFSPIAFEVRDTTSFLGSIGELKRANESLEKERVNLLAENAKLRDLGKENEELRRSLDLLPRDRYDTIGATVIGRDVSGIGSWLQINQGSNRGIKEGMAVIVEAGVLVGRVEEVFPHSARVMLLSNPESIVNAITVDTDAQGVIKGEHGLGIIYDMVLQADVLKSGDTVVTSGLGETAPKGLLVGTLQDVRLTDDKLFQRATLSSPVRFDRLRYVFVVSQVKSE